MPIGAGFDSPTSTRPSGTLPTGGGGTPGGGGATPSTVQDQYLRMMASDPDGAEQFINGFYAWAIAQGVVADPNDPALSQAYTAEILGLDDQAGGGGGRTQFASEAALDMATTGLREEQAKSEAFMRAKSKYDLLQVTDQLADSRREAATEALTSLLPFMVNPDQEFTPGFEPGGVGPQLGSLLGANVPAQQLPTMEVPLNELANPPLAAPAQDISGGLQSLL